MINFLLSLVFFVSLIPGCLSQVDIDEERSTITFLFLDDDVDGSIEGLEFTGVIYPNDFINSSLDGSVTMESLDTDNWFRDRHLRSSKYFNNREHPRLFFESKYIMQVGNNYQVKGDLTIKGISKEVLFEFKLTDNKAQGTTTINTADFDIRIHDERQRNQVDIVITLVYD